MNLNENSTYKFERKSISKDTYHVKLTTELMEDLENSENINEVEIKIDEKTGTLTLPTKNNFSKVFNLNIEPITRGPTEKLELNLFRSNNSVEYIAPINIRLNVQATSKVYDMTKKRIVEVEDENKKHCAKQLNLHLSPNKNSRAYKVFQNKESRKMEEDNQSHVAKKSSSSLVSEKRNHSDIKKPSEFTIREKVLNLLALKPTSKDCLLLHLQKLGVTSSDRHEVEKHLHQIATLNKENLYQLSNQFIFEIREDWPQFNEESRKKIAKLKSDVKSTLPSQNNNAQVPRHSIQRDMLPSNDDIERQNARKTAFKQQQQQDSSQTKNTALSMLSAGKSVSDICRLLNISEKVLNSWRTLETKPPKEPGNKKPLHMSPIGHRNSRQDTISPAESNSSSKTVASNDEGFVSGDKTSPMKSHNGVHQNKRRSQHLSNDLIKDQSCKKIRLSEQTSSQPLSRNDLNSSSSCDMTPKSDVSGSSNGFKSLKPKSNFNIETHGQIKTNKTDLDNTQDKFNIAFEEYSKLCTKLKEREAEIEKLRSKCMNAKSTDYPKLYKIARSYLDDMETPQFQEVTARVKTLESEMSDYVRILTDRH